MGMEGSDVHIDKEPDGVIVYSNGITGDSGNGTASQHEMSQPSELINLDPPPVDILDENVEEQAYEVKECNSEINVSKEDATCEGQKATDDKKTRDCGKKITKSAVGNSKTKCTIPQPFALATEKRATNGTRPNGMEFDNKAAGDKPAPIRVLPHPTSAKQNQVQAVSPSAPRKPLQPDNKKRLEEDNCSVASSNVASARKFKTTVASAPVFKSSERAERRKEFYLKLEEKHQALEAEKSQYEARSKEEMEAAIKQLRKSLTFKASPMPSFYHEGPPPKMELKKPPPTRAKSPKLGRRKSFSDAKDFDKGTQEARHSFHIFRDSPPMSSTNRKTGTNIKRGTTSKLIAERHMDIAVHS